MVIKRIKWNNPSTTWPTVSVQECYCYCYSYHSPMLQRINSQIGKVTCPRSHRFRTQTKVSWLPILYSFVYCAENAPWRQGEAGSINLVFQTGTFVTKRGDLPGSHTTDGSVPCGVKNTGSGIGDLPLLSLGQPWTFSGPHLLSMPHFLPPN